jgi:hypothetical protein
MSTRYSSEAVAAVMVLLERNRGDVQRTADQTGVPDRTIYRWQRQVLTQLRRYTPLSPQTAEGMSMDVPVFENDLATLSFIRQNIINELSRLSASLKDDPGISTPYQRALVLSQLMDKLLKLDGHLRPLMGDDDDVFELSDDVEETEDEEYA